jgi:hypothetical protein
MAQKAWGETWTFNYRVGREKVAGFGRFIQYKHPFYIFYATNDMINPVYPDFFIYFVEYIDVIERTKPHATDKYDSVVRKYLEDPLLQIPLEKNVIYVNYYDLAKEQGLPDNGLIPTALNKSSPP